MCRLLAIALTFLSCLETQGGEKNAANVTAYQGATIHTAIGPPIDNGILIIRGNKIFAVGKVGQLKVPQGANVVDVKGKVIIPGLVDTHSHLGLWGRPDTPATSDGNEGSGPVQSGLRALDAINPNDPGIRMALAGGITTANIMPGSGNVIGGQTLYVKYRGVTVEEMRIKSDTVLGGLKMANGENPKRFNFERNQRAPSTRMKLTALQREQFLKAQAYQKKWQEYRQKDANGEKINPPERDINLDSLVEVLERKRTVHFHSHRSDDLMTAIRLSKEFNFELVIQHGTEGYLIKDELAKNKIPVSLTLIDSPGGKYEVMGLLEENGAILDKAGVKVAINTDDAITESRFFLRTGAFAVRGGMSELSALKALTLHGAEMMHLEDRVGSLEAGKDADFVILSGAPFSVYTQVLETYLEGERVFARSDSREGSFQTGGFNVLDAKRSPKPAPLMKPLKAVKAPEAPKGAKMLKGNPESYAVLAGRIHTVSQGDILNGVILVEKGKIKQVGKRADVKIPGDVPVVTASVVTPGLIDANCVVGVGGALNIGADQDQNEGSGPIQTELRVMDAFNPREPLLEYLRRQGVTVVHATPGPANVIAGQSGIFRTYGLTAEKMALRRRAGLLINLGEAPKAAYKDKVPTTRMATASLVRDAFTKAKNHLALKKEMDPKMEPLILALQKKMPVLFNAHRADDVQTALRLAKEFNLDARIHSATEGYLMSETLKKSGVPVVVHPTLQRNGSLETLNTHLNNAAVLAQAKIPMAMGSGFEAYVPKTRVVRFEAAMAMVNGLGYPSALKMITLDAAKILGIDKEYGSLDAGKVADLVLYDGDPFEHTTHVTHTIVGGRVTYSRADYLKLPFERRALRLTGSGVGCCLGRW